MTRAREALARSAPSVDVIVDSPLWAAEKGAKALVRRAVAAAARKASSGSGELAILLTDDSHIRVLNRDWRGQDKATNVLSFPAEKSAARGDGNRHLGDIAIAFETSAREAAAEGKPLAHHLAHLAVHGYLHLVGHDHQNDDEAKMMERLEAAILTQLKMPDPYGPRARRRGA